METSHPEITLTVARQVFYLKIWASNAVFATHVSAAKNTYAPIEKDAADETNFRHEDTANRIATAMIHPMELCGCGVAKKSLF